MIPCQGQSHRSATLSWRMRCWAVSAISQEISAKELSIAQLSPLQLRQLYSEDKWCHCQVRFADPAVASSVFTAQGGQLQARELCGGELFCGDLV